MDIQQRKDAFSRLGYFLQNTGNKDSVTFNNKAEEDAYVKLQELTSGLVHYNGWFDKEHVIHALTALGKSLTSEKLDKWLEKYDTNRLHPGEPNTIGVVMAGNVPAVGFHDFLTVLVSGNRLLAKLSSDDNKLMPAISDLLVAIEPAFAGRIEFTDGILKGFSAIIATGSNNTARYFEYYFGKYPNIIRKNRNGVAVLTGEETEQELNLLADDIFLYYGLGCRNVAKLFIPQNYDFDPLLKVLSLKTKVAENHKYFNNYEYNKAVFLVNKRDHKDTGNLLLVEDEAFASPVSVVHYEYYENLQFLKNKLAVNSEKIQCVVTGGQFVENAVPFGKSQQPELWDYADGVDTMDFLTGELAG